MSWWIGRPLAYTNDLTVVSYRRPQTIRGEGQGEPFCYPEGRERLVHATWGWDQKHGAGSTSAARSDWVSAAETEASIDSRSSGLARWLA